MQVDKDITIYDIAEKLQLSSSIISRALRNHPGIKNDTRRKIVETAESLGYMRNSFASNIKSNRTKTIGIIVQKLNSNFIVSVIAGIEKMLTAAGYATIITHSSENHEREVANAQSLFHRRVDGLIVSLSGSGKNLAHFKPFRTRAIPVIFVDNVPAASKDTSIVIDNYTGGYQLTQHLIEQGCNNIVLVTGNPAKSVYRLRHMGYKDALMAHQLPYKKNRVIVSSFDEASSEKAALKILKMRPLPDGVFIMNDFAAAVCLQTLKKNGIKIPGDIAIVGFNNDPVCQVVEPQLTTVNYPGINLGETAARHLLDHLDGSTDEKKTGTIVMDSGLVIRGSSRRIIP